MNDTIASIQDLVEVVSRDHFPNPSASKEMIEDFESRNKVLLPSDVIYFYSQCNGAKLFQDFDAPFEIVPLDKLCPLADKFYEHICNEVLKHIYSMCLLRDRDFVGIELRTCTHGSDAAPIFDCFHEAFPEYSEEDVIAGSFTEFLAATLPLGGKKYWLIH